MQVVGRGPAGVCRSADLGACERNHSPAVSREMSRSGRSEIISIFNRIKETSRSALTQRLPHRDIALLFHVRSSI
jgi:hypothetical protein